MISREELISICEQSVVPHYKWINRDSYFAQVNIQSIYAGLKAGIKYSTNVENNTIWVDFEEPTDEQQEELNMHYLNIDSREQYFEWYKEEYGEENMEFVELFDGNGINWKSSYRGGFMPTQERLNASKGNDWY